MTVATNANVFHTIQWGDAPTWVAAIGTVLALGFTALGLWQAVQTLKLQRSDQAGRDERERRADAEKVSALTDLVGASQGQPTDVYEVVVVNRGNDMIFHIIVEIPDGQLDGVTAMLIADYDRLSGCSESAKPMPTWPRRVPGIPFRYS
jgi:hypothetical protein